MQKTVTACHFCASLLLLVSLTRKTAQLFAYLLDFLPELCRAQFILKCSNLSCYWLFNVVGEVVAQMLNMKEVPGSILSASRIFLNIQYAYS